MKTNKSPWIAAGHTPGSKKIKMPPRPDSPEQRLHDIVATVGDWIWETNEILAISFVSDRCKETTGLNPEILKGKTLQQVVLADDSPGKRSPVVLTLEHSEPFQGIACSIISATGEVLHFTLSGIPYYADNHMFKGYRGAAQNITHQLEAQRKYYEAIQDGPANHLAEFTPDEVLDRASSAEGGKEAFVI